LLDLTAIRNDFPILQRQVGGHPLVYIDNAATSQKPNQVIRAITRYYEDYNSNVHRGVHTLSMEATDEYEKAREKVSNFLNAPSSDTIIWVRNTTEAINLVSYTWAQSHLSPGQDIVLTEMEHHSNLVPWQHLAKMKNLNLKFIPVKDDGLLDIETAKTLIGPNTGLLGIIHMSNVLGTINPIKELAQFAHSFDVPVLVDAAQSIPHMRLDVQDLNCDFLAFSGHKMLGPTGIGVLYVKQLILDQMDPFLRGGEMVLDVGFTHATWNDIPMKFEAGTPNIAGAIALASAIDYLEDIGISNIHEHERSLTEYAVSELDRLEVVNSIGPRDFSVRGGIVSFDIPNLHPHDLGTYLDHIGIAIRTGHHCAMPLVRDKLGLVATARASFYLYNSLEEVEKFVTGVASAIRYFKA
jgi:cysteine desulfurase/selenocysteine lyase